MTSIEGGFVLANDPEDRLRLRGMRAHGWIRHLPAEVQDTYKATHKDIDPRFLFVDIGFNMRPLDLCAAIGRQQLQRLEEANGFRRANYHAILKGLEGETRVYMPPPPEEAEVAFLAMPLIFSPEVDLKAVQASLEKMGVQTRPVISGNFLRQPMMSRWGLESEDPTGFPGAEAIHHQGIYIGLHGVVWSPSYCEALCSRILGALTSK